ncbi:DNA topoisomerase I [Humidesulfovibrio mexicanus]|uniref:DNA topoisomerase 1 n=2 Tax=Humidesulfovibrio mexicanus TaxID=147047 RepID=A0A238ZZ92_9BACT|nr:DNA topoisomerase I [Humidesulfovibrio mexicanus]
MVAIACRMTKDLIIVESPAKVKTIGKFLGKDYAVEASVGHVRDLPKGDMGLDEEHGYAPRYEIIKGKEDVVGRLRKAAKAAKHVYLAPDPDREGEAIGWHVAELIRTQNKNVSRIQFNEITARAVKEALENPRPINADLVGAQQARRVLDRLVGYKISPILWKHVKRGISAGRVQSVALRLIVDRERERRAFQPVEHWALKAKLAGENPPPFRADLWKIGTKTVAPGMKDIGSAEAAGALVQNVRAGTFVVDAVEEKERSKSAPPPFTTSSLQQVANRALGYPAKKTMGAAQKLYEGVDLGERGTVALITYMRTDSVRIADEAKKAAHEFILSAYGKDYAPAKARVYKTKDGAQDAHEACRPVDVTLTPESVKQFLPADQFKLYQLIWRRFVASQMSPARFHDTTVSAKNGTTLWRAKGERLLFPGFLKVQGLEAPTEADADAEPQDGQSAQLPKVAVGEALQLLDLTSEQKFTQPPPRYSEATLVKALEEEGIGRPSTYAAIISTLQDREYVAMEDKRFAPTELGATVSDKLVAHFATLMDIGFTAGMETKLDEIAAGGRAWEEVIEEFMAEFIPALEKAGTEMSRATIDSGVACPECGRPMHVKFGKNGEFLGCSGYPECKAIREFTRDEQGTIIPVDRPKEEITDILCELCGKPFAVKVPRKGRASDPFLGCTGYPKCKNIKNFKRDEFGAIIVLEAPEEIPAGTCPECGKPMVIKTARRGSKFIACTGYPACKHTEPLPTGVACPQPGCTGEMVEKTSRRGKVFYSCSRYPDCTFSLWDRPVPGPCPKCGFPLLVEKHSKAKGDFIACGNKDCDWVKDEGEGEK